MNETKRLIFKVDRLKKKHGSLEALNVKKLEVHPGTIYALVGPPGCGKTTLLEILSGSQKQTSGELYFENFAYETNWFGKIKKHNEIFYNYGFDENGFGSTVSKVIGRMYGKKSNTIMKRHFNSLKSKHLWKRSLSSLTKGELHWVGMVLSLESDPRVLLIDDYGVHLTNEMEQEFRNQLKRMNRTLGTTIIVSSPSEAIVKNFASVIIFMDNGHISKIRSKSNRIGRPRRQGRRSNYNQKKKTSNKRGSGNRYSGNISKKPDDKQHLDSKSKGSKSRHSGNINQKRDDKKYSKNKSPVQIKSPDLSRSKSIKNDQKGGGKNQSGVTSEKSANQSSRKEEKIENSN